MIDAIALAADLAVSFLMRWWPALAVVVVADLIARRSGFRFRTLPRILRRSTAAAMLIAAAASLAVSVSVFLVRGEPLPLEQDEYNHLLVMDTLLHGRLANPPHPMWRQLEDPIAIQQPTYSSKYPIGNGALLACGRLVFGLPIAGIWIASAAAAAAVGWAARAWLPPSWSLLAGLAIALHPTFTAWNTAYQRGSLPALAGAVLLGAAARLVRRPSARLVAIASAALMTLAISRPFEGLMYAIGVSAFVVAEGFARRPGRRRHTILAIARKLPIAIPIVAAGFVLIAMHNRAVTGNALTMPHLLHDRQYERAPNFVWQAPYPAKTYRSQELRMLFAGAYWSFYERLTAPGGWWRVGIVEKVAAMRDLAFPNVVDAVYPLQFLPLVVLPWSLRRRRTRLLLVVTGIAAIAPLLFVQPVLGQYVAPAAAAVAILYVLLARELIARFRSRGGVIVLAMIIVCVFVAMRAAVVTAHVPQPQPEADRRAIVAGLERLPGKHLILVPPDVFGCVFNEADVDGSHVVWARQLSPASDAELMRYFRERNVWQLVNTSSGLRVVGAPAAGRQSLGGAPSD